MIGCLRRATPVGGHRPALADGTANPVPQNELMPHDGLIKEAPKLFKEHGKIDWNKDARAIHNQIRGLNPFPGAWTTLPDGERCACTKALRLRLSLVEHLARFTCLKTNWSSSAAQALWP